MPLNILHISNSDKQGGAQRAAYWLARGLIDLGISLTYLVEIKTSSEHWIQEVPRINTFRKALSLVCEKIPLLLYMGRSRRAWSNNIFSRIPIARLLTSYKPDIVNLHWIGGGLISFKDFINVNQPLVISLYDMWFFTGGCHYSASCLNYLSVCCQCPHLSSSGYDLSTLNYLGKLLSFKNSLSITFVAPSSWLAEEAKKSKVLSQSNIVTIPHGTDCSIFKPINRENAIYQLHLDLSYRYILFASTGGLLDPRKGYQYLAKALKFCDGYKLNTKLLILGPDNPDVCGINHSFDYVHIKSISNDDTLSLIYSASTLVATPSGQEAFGMTASEALCCGTPVVAFAHYGPLDVVEHKVTGYLAEPYNHVDLSSGIKFVLDHPSPTELSRICRAKALNKFSLSSVAQQYKDLYSRVLHC